VIQFNMQEWEYLWICNIRRQESSHTARIFKSLLNVLEMAQKHQEPGKTYARSLWG